MLAAAFFTYSAVALILTVNALRPPSPPDARTPPLWLPAMLSRELAPQLLVLRTLVAVAAAGSVTRLAIGRAGMLLLAVAQAGTLVLWAWERRTLRELGQPPVRVPGRWYHRAVRWPYRLPPEVERVDDLSYAPGLTLDLYRRRDLTAPAPVVVYVHGGGWTGGGPRKASRVILHHLARRGWVVAAIRYPLSPQATFPDHLVGVKRALAWCRQGGREWGIDPEVVVVMGASAGAHLAALAALTPGLHQPGFEHLDASAHACVALYGVFDFLNRHRTRVNWPLIPVHVMKAAPSQDPDRYRQASPLDQVGPQAPPFLVIHGKHDSLVPPTEARHFVAALEQASQRPVRYVEVWGAQHAFDVVASPRVRATAGLVAAFLDDEVLSDRRRAEAG